MYKFNFYKKRLSIFKIIGAVLIICGIITLSYWVYTENKYSTLYTSSVENSSITKDEFSEMLKNSREGYVETEDNDIDDFIAFEELNSDQQVDKVELYKNVLKIDKCNILAYIGDDVDKETLKRGVGHHPNTAEPGSIGNCVIPGHSSTTYNCIFNGLENIDILDTFNIYDKNGVRHLYYVTDKYTTDPYDTSLFLKTVDGISQTILYTCTEHGTKRLVVIGKEFDEYELKKFKEELDKYLGEQLASISASITDTGLSNFLKTWGKELEVRHDELPLVEVNNLKATHNYLYADNQQFWFNKNEHKFKDNSYITNFYFNLYKF